MTAADSWKRARAQIIARAATGPVPDPGQRCLLCGHLLGARGGDQCEMAVRLWGEELTHVEARARALEEYQRASGDKLDNGRDIG